MEEREEPLFIILNGEEQHIYIGGSVFVTDMNWLAEQGIRVTENKFDVVGIDHDESVLILRRQVDEQKRIFILRAENTLVIHIPEAYRRNNEDERPIPPYRVENVKQGRCYPPDVEVDIDPLYFTYERAQAALKNACERVGGTWTIINGYGNICDRASPEQEPDDE